MEENKDKNAANALDDLKQENELKSDEAAENTHTVEANIEKVLLTGKKKIIAILAAIVIVIFVGIYVGVAIHYQSHFLPGTSVNNIDCSGMDAAQVAGLLENQLQTYVLEVTGRNYATGESGALLGTLAASDINLVYAKSSRETVDELLKEQNTFFWPAYFLSKEQKSISLVQGISYDNEVLATLLNSWEACQKKNMDAPENAYISEYQKKTNSYEIVSETIGTEFDVKQVQELIDVAIHSNQATLDIEAAGCYAQAEIDSQNAKLVEAVSAANKMLGTRITYNWNETEVILDSEQLKEWVSIDKNRALLDEDAVKGFVEEQAAAWDTYGKPRNFLTKLGVELLLPSGYYGWQTDREAETEELLKLIYAGKVEDREPVYSSTARQKGMSDIGSSYVEADLTHQHLYLYQNGEIVFETDFVSGSMSSTPDCVTPQGVFGLSYKTTNAVLRGANYETPVTYWMPFYGNYGLHDATWRYNFGGDIYITDGSHGCLNLPLDAAAVIYEYVSTGFPIVCYYYPEGTDPLAVVPPVEESVVPDNSEE